MTATASIEEIAGALQDEPSVRALFLSGSYGSGLEDAYSDVDFLAVTTGGPTDEFAELWSQAVRRTGEIVLWWDRQPKNNLINAITDSWLRVDVEIVTRAQMPRRAKHDLKVLFDHDQIYDALPAQTEAPRPSLQRVKWQFENFIRVLGLMSLAIGRAEYFTGVTGVFHLRSLLVDLLLEETAAPNRDGALHLNRLLTEEQRNVLASLPLPSPTTDGVIEANLACASAYLPRARQMARKLGIA